MTNYPNCKSKNTDKFICLRCGAEFEQLAKIEDSYSYQMSYAIKLFSKSEYDKALPYLENALKVKQSLLSRILIALCKEKIKPTGSNLFIQDFSTENLEPDPKINTYC